MATANRTTSNRSAGVVAPRSVAIPARRSGSRAIVFASLLEHDPMSTKNRALSCLFLPMSTKNRALSCLFLLKTSIRPWARRGTCYKAANWIHVGRTVGRGKKSRVHAQIIPIKDVWLYPLRRDFSSVLVR
jgi:hypothetical protein